MQVTTHLSHDQCVELQARISALRNSVPSLQATIDAAKIQIVHNCANLDSGGYLGAYVTASNSLSKAQADIESSQSYYEHFCFSHH